MRQMQLAVGIEPDDLDRPAMIVELYNDRIAVRIGYISLHGTASDIRQLLLNAIGSINEDTTQS